jgi:archaellum component FlaG (FlaF/FlaG flagellin family)
MIIIIFVVGVLVSAMVVGGLVLTVSEVRRLEREGSPERNARFPL